MRSVSVPATADTIDEADETYTLTVGGVSGTGTITDDDGPPTIASVSSNSAVEASNVVHTVTLSNASSSATTFALSLADVTANLGSDYTNSLTFSTPVKLSQIDIEDVAGAEFDRVQGAATDGTAYVGSTRLTHDIPESVAVIEAVKKHKRVLQTGSMQRSSREFRVACELVRNGAIGAGRIMSAGRRAQIVAVARKHDLMIIEDDIYAVYAPDSPPPFAVLAPERTFHVSGVSKSLAPGLRTGFLIVPPGDHMDRVLRTVRALSYAPPNFGGLIATQWIEDGTADAIVAEIQTEMTARLAMAREILGGAIETPMSASAPHVWLPMSELDAERLAGRALRGGVELTPPSAPVVEPGLTTGVRLCLGAARDRDELERGLRIVAAAVADVDERSRAVI